MPATLNPNPHRLAPERLYATVTVVMLVHASLFWTLDNELAALPTSDESGAILLADVLTDTPQPSRATVTPTALASKPSSPSAHNLPLAQTAEPSTTQAAAPPGKPSANTSAAAAAHVGSPSLVEPTADADYLKNPPPVYPRASRRLGEQGTVIVRVFISAQGVPEKTEVRSSSGFARLDQAALDAVQRWRFVPGRRGGMPEAMWFNIPVRFVLE